MERRTLDSVVAALVAFVLITGAGATWQAWQSYQQVNSGMMGGMMTTSMMNTGPSPLWLLFGTVAIAAIIAIGYLAIRENVAGSQATTGGVPGRGTEPMGPATTSGDDLAETRRAAADPDSPPSSAETDSPAGEPTAEANASRPRSAILDVLPEDERRILEPIIHSPGLTQIELRDRADFSKSKVSQTVSDLEKRGLVSRERQGRTYRLYPGEDIAES